MRKLETLPKFVGSKSAISNFAITITLAILLILPLNTVFAFYNDVPKTSQYYTSIKALFDAKLLPDTTSFRPNDLLKNAELYEMLIEFSGTEPSKNPDLPYTDTENTAKYAPFLQTALDLGVLQPSNSNLKFEPDKTLPKYKVLEIMFKTLDIGTNPFYDRNNFPFSDITKSSTTAPIAQKAFDMGITEPATPTLFKMTKRITRGEAADYIYKIKQYKKLDQVTIIYKLEAPTENYDTYNYSDTEKELVDNQSFKTLLDVWGTLKNDYLYKDKLSNTDLIFGAIEGMVNQADDTYTVFEKPGEDTILTSLSSEYDGIGISIEMIDEKVTIISPFKDSPAEKAGLKPNDIITKVDGESIADQKLSDIVNKIKGPPGTTVTLTILRDKKESTYTVTRESIFYETVSHRFIEKNGKNIAYLELTSFNDETTTEFEKAAEDIIDKKANGLILDLRNNPGGYLDVAVDIIGMFTDKGKIAVKMQFADNSTETYKTIKKGPLKDLKTVILINNGSASASEIVAGALQDYKIAKLIGEKSFGKGTVQNVTEYRDNSVFKYTTAKWLTPNGRDINKKGLTPDKLITKPGTVDTQLEAALKEF